MDEIYSITQILEAIEEAGYDAAEIEKILRGGDGDWQE